MKGKSHGYVKPNFVEQKKKYDMVSVQRKVTGTKGKGRG